jgi:hypothetical protein
MSINKNFVVKHGLEVNSDLILANSNTKRVGIATTVPGYTLDVAGGIGVTHLSVTGIGSVKDLHVGTNGELFRAIGAAGSVGVGTAFPAYLLDVRTQSDSGTKALYVRGDVQVTGDLLIDDISVNQATFDHIYVGTAATAVNLYVPISGIATIGVGIVTTLSGTNVNYSGIGTIVTFGSTRSTITNLVGTSNTLTNIVSTSSTITNIVGTSNTLTNIVSTSSTITNFTGTSSTISQLRISGVASIAILDAATVIVSGIAATNLTVTNNFNVLGIATLSQLGVSGVTTSRNLQVVGFTTLANSSVTGVSTIGDLAVSGVTTSRNLQVVGFTTLANSSVTGVSTITTANITNLTGTSSTITQQRVTGISTLLSTTLVGTSSSTGTASQTLQVSGGSYISGSLGVGKTLPAYTVDVFGDVNITGSFLQNGAPLAGFTSVSYATTAFGLENSPNILVGVVTANQLRTTGILTAPTAVFGSNVTANSTGINVSGIVTATSSVFGSNVTSNASGITVTSGSITTPTAIVGSNVTANSSGINVSGIVTATTIRGTTIVAGSNVTSNASGITVTSGILTAPTAVIGSNVTINSTGINASGIVTATQFKGRSGFAVAMSLVFGY